MTKIVITGAHFTPAVAVIEQLQQNYSVEIVYIGRKTTREGDRARSVESQVLPKMGVKFLPIMAGRVQRTFTLFTIPSLFKIPIGFVQAIYFLLKEKPDVVLSFGGYVAVPVVLAAWLFSVPIITHEQTLVTGLASRVSNIFADKVALSFKHILGNKKRMVLTGNPLRKDILLGEVATRGEIKELIRKKEKSGKPLILITGGNQGSHVINLAVEQILGGLAKLAIVVHQTGDSKYRDYERLEEKRASMGISDQYLPIKWIDGADMAQLFKNIDLVISRAGINTLTELAFFGVPTIVIPLPYLYKNEQLVNARFFEENGLAQILTQQKLSGKSLFEMVKKMLGNLGFFKKKALGAREVVIKDGAQRLALETMLLARK